MQIRLKTLLDTCTYVVFDSTRRGLFDRDKLIVLTLLTFHIMVKVRPEFGQLCSHSHRNASSALSTPSHLCLLHVTFAVCLMHKLYSFQPI